MDSKSQTSNARKLEANSVECIHCYAVLSLTAYLASERRARAHLVSLADETDIVEFVSAKLDLTPLRIVSVHC